MKSITVTTEINAPAAKVWEFFNEPQHVTQWNFAHESWCCPRSENDLKTGGFFTHRMEARDGSFGFDLTGIYDEIIPEKLLRYHLEDGRKVIVIFNETAPGKTEVVETFDAEDTHPEEQQRQGWQAILNNFKIYSEKSK